MLLSVIGISGGGYNFEGNLLFLDDKVEERRVSGEIKEKGQQSLGVGGEEICIYKRERGEDEENRVS